MVLLKLDLDYFHVCTFALFFMRCRTLSPIFGPCKLTPLLLRNCIPSRQGICFRWLALLADTTAVALTVTDAKSSSDADGKPLEIGQGVVAVCVEIALLGASMMHSWLYAV